MRAAAQLLAEVGDVHHPHPVAIFVVEEGQRAGLDRLVESHLLRFHAIIVPDPLVDDPLELLELALGHRPGMREIEPQPVGRHQRARLLDPFAEQFPQRRVQHMRGGMIAGRA